LNGKDGWTRYSAAGSFQTDSNSLIIGTGAHFATNPRGALLAGIYTDGEARLLVLKSNPTALLGWHHDTATDKCLAIWCAPNGSGGFVLDAGVIQGSLVTAFATPASPSLPAVGGVDFYLGIRTVGKVLELRAWAAAGTRPDSPTYSCTLTGYEVIASGQVRLGCIQTGALVTQLQVIV
jgi:hypothetical protein